MSALGLSVRESFDPANPWVRRLTGIPPTWKRRREVLPFLLLAAGLPIIAVAWMMMFLAPVHGLSPLETRALATSVGTATTYAMLLTAFAAPAMGVGARFRLERSPILIESLTTGFPWRAHVAAMHARVLLGTLFAGGLAVVIAVSMTQLVAGGRPDITEGLDSSRFGLLLALVRELRLGEYRSLGMVALETALIGAMALNFVAGYYSRASINASVTPFGAQPALLTCLLVGVAMGTFLLRRILPDHAWRWGTSAVPPQGVILFVQVILEVACIPIRLWLARQAWRSALTQDPLGREGEPI